MIFLRRASAAQQVATRQRQASVALSRAVYARAVTTPAPLPGEPSCCCPAPAAIRVFLRSPSAVAGETGAVVDILLCAHHYAASARRLKDLGAVAVGTQLSL